MSRWSREVGSGITIIPTDENNTTAGEISGDGGDMGNHVFNDLEPAGFLIGSGDVWEGEGAADAGGKFGVLELGEGIIGGGGEVGFGRGAIKLKGGEGGIEIHGRASRASGGTSGAVANHGSGSEIVEIAFGEVKSSGDRGVENVVVVGADGVHQETGFGGTVGGVEDTIAEVDLVFDREGKIVFEVVGLWEFSSDIREVIGFSGVAGLEIQEVDAVVTDDEVGGGGDEVARGTLELNGGGISEDEADGDHRS